MVVISVTTGNKGKFSERLKKIARFKRMKKNNSSYNIDDGANLNFFRRILLVPVALVQNTILNSIENKKKNNKTKDVDKKITVKNIETKKEEFTEIVEKNIVNYSINNDVNLHKLDKNTRKLKVNKVKDIDTSFMAKVFLLKNRVSSFEEVNELCNDKEKLEKEIINLIKKRLVKCINEYEILQSDLFILKETLNDDVYYNKCLENIKEIKKLLSKVNSLKDKYDYLKDNYDFEYLLEIDDDTLTDKIIDLKNLLNTNRVPDLVKDYKLLDEYKYLYLKVDKLQEEAILYEEKKNDKIKELKNRDVDFEKLKKKISDKSLNDDKYKDYLNSQNSKLKNLFTDVSKIESREVIDYSVKGFGDLLKSSFKYLGLLMLSPLKGTFPGIAKQTAFTKGEIKRLRSSLTIDEKRYNEYFAYDYSDELRRCINDIDYTSESINSTLVDIINLKKEYTSKFKGYQDKFPEYASAIKKINKIENSIIGSKIKLDMVKTKMLEKEKINNNKMIKIRILNDQNK